MTRGSATVVVALLMQVISSDARADCVHAEVFVERQNAATVYPIGSNPCVTPTPWNQGLEVGPVDVGHTGVPDGVPKRLYVDIRIPAP